MTTKQPKDTDSNPSVKPVEKQPVSPSLYQLRKYFVYILVGGLIVSALIAIIAVLVGEMTDIISKATSTVFIVILHSLIALGFISVTSSGRPNTGSSIIVNTLFTITVLSLITSLLAVWDIVTDRALIVNQYKVYFTAVLTSIMIYGLLRSTEKDKSTVISRNVAIGSTLALFALSLPALYEMNNLPDIYYRVLVATGIVVSVSIVITIIFHWYFMSKNPQAKSTNEEAEQAGFMTDRPVLRVFVIIFGIFFGLPMALGILSSVISTVFQN